MGRDTPPIGRIALPANAVAGQIRVPAVLCQSRNGPGRGSWCSGVLAIIENTVEILDRLVGFDTVSANPNAKIIDFIEAYCSKHGAICTRLPASATGKLGLVARFGPDEPGGILLSGHCDVVPVAGQNWSRPPFELTRDADRLFGRGTTDMKGFLACMLTAGEVAAQRPLSKPLTLVFSYDEEIGCVGIQEMAPLLPDVLGKPRLCIVGEPTDMAVATGHKGKVGLRAVCIGENGHSALAPNFVNALHLAADFVSELRDLQDWYAENGAQDDAYDVPYSTLHVGTLHGGTALNIVPDKATMTFEYRYLPADGEATLFAKIETAAEKVGARYRGRFPKAVVTIERDISYPGLDVPKDGDEVQLARALSPIADFTKVAFGTEAGVFDKLGIPTVVCGPGSMSGQGHKPDEYIELSQLVACRSMLDKAVETLR